MPTSQRADWFRRTTWTNQDEAEFFARLGRSRTMFHKAQYLRIQGFTLWRAGHADPALTLLNLLVSDYPEESQLASAQEHRGSILRKQGHIEAAIAAFAAGHEAELRCPTFHTRCSLLLGVLIVEERLVDRYPQAQEAVESYAAKNPDFLLPVDAYQLNLVRAAVAKHKKNETRARRYAKDALDAANMVSSGLPGYPKLGIVGSATSKLHAWLRRWSA
jgi:tetratricopeptide (TPR) repeat protein